MRLIGIGLLAFLLVGAALLFSKLSVWGNSQRVIGEFIQGTQLVFETQQAVDSNGETEATIMRAGSNQPLLLTGLPSYQTAAFFMPITARPTSGYLQLDATLQIAKGVEGVLRVSIDNVKKGEILLPVGQVRKSLKIPLSPAELIREKLVVSISLQGNGANSACSIDTGVEAVVEIETTSAIFVKLSEPIETAYDRVKAWGNVTRVMWPHWIKPDDGLRRFVEATQLLRDGFEAVYVDQHSDDALNTAQLRELRQSIGKSQLEPEHVVWPKPIDMKGPNAGLRRFFRTTSWRETHALRSKNSGLLLKHLNLDLYLGRQSDNAKWSVIVTLNKRLVHENLVDAIGANYSKVVDLPLNFQQLNNVIEITVSSTYFADGECDSGPELTAELLPQTSLEASETEYFDPLTELRGDLDEFETLTVGFAKQLNAAEASVATSLLASFLPEKPLLKPGFSEAKITVFGPILAEDDLPLDVSSGHVVYRHPRTQQLVVEEMAHASGQHRNSVHLLISNPTRQVMGGGNDQFAG